MFQSLMELTKNSDAFFFQDYVRNGYTYRVFNYRLASYTDFCKENALEMRGITYVLPNSSDSEPLLVSRPFAKFFNYLENPMTTGLDLSKATKYEVKADGSLIASYFNPFDKTFGLKSKQAFFSEQAFMAEEFLSREENSTLKQEVYDLSRSGYTVLMELCSPANRIVLEYDTTHLIVHGVRSNSSGEYLTKNMLDGCTSLMAAWVETTEVNGLSDTFIAEVEAMKGIEGYVVHGPWGRFKIKTEWYRNLHHLKDSVSSEKSLISSILYERVDDVKAMFNTDSFTLDRISSMEGRVLPVYNKIVSETETFYNNNKGLDRKSFAIKGLAEIPTLFHLAMALYLGRSVDYRLFAMDNYRSLFNITTSDEPIGE